VLCRQVSGYCLVTYSSVINISSSNHRSRYQCTIGFYTSRDIAPNADDKKPTFDFTWIFPKPLNVHCTYAYEFFDTVVGRLKWSLLSLGADIKTVVEGTDDISRQSVEWAILCLYCCCQFAIKRKFKLLKCLMLRRRFWLQHLYLNVHTILVI